jgi:uncharacterized protein YaaN involved in tellurite resistance
MLTAISTPADPNATENPDMTKDPARPDSGQSGARLALPPIDEIERDLKTPVEAPTTDDAELEQLADSFVREVLAADPQQTLSQREAIDGMGVDIQRRASQRSAMLQTPIRRLAHQGDEGGTVANALVELRGKMQELDPSRQSLTTGGIARALSFIPGVGNKLQRYFSRFENAQEAIDRIIHDLDAGAGMLRRDNVTLADDQAELRKLITQLDRQVALGRLIDARLETAAARADDTQRGFIEEELQFPLRQRIVDLQQQLTVCQQGVLALEVIIRNNRELVRGVTRAINVTVSALNVAVTTALALANQRLVLDRIEALNDTTSSLIAGTAKALRSQGADIQNRAASTMLDMESLEQAFGDVLGAIDEVSRYRREALPRLDAQIERLETLATRGNEAITRMDEGNAAGAGQKLD